MDQKKEKVLLFLTRLDNQAQISSLLYLHLVSIKESIDSFFHLSWIFVSRTAMELQQSKNSQKFEKFLTFSTAMFKIKSFRYYKLGLSPKTLFQSKNF